MLANISQFEALQAGANRSMGLQSEVGIFNDTDFYEGLPSDLDQWVSDYVYGKKGNPATEYFRYQIFKKMNGDYALQATTTQNIPGEKLPKSGYMNKVVATGDLDTVTAKHQEFTGKPPRFKQI